MWLFSLVLNKKILGMISFVPVPVRGDGVFLLSFVDQSGPFGDATFSGSLLL